MLTAQIRGVSALVSPALLHQGLCPGYTRQAQGAQIGRAREYRNSTVDMYSVYRNKIEGVHKPKIFGLSKILVTKRAPRSAQGGTPSHDHPQACSVSSISGQALRAYLGIKNLRDPSKPWRP